MMKWLALALAGLVVIFVVALVVRRNMMMQPEPSTNAGYEQLAAGLIGGVKKLFTSSDKPQPFFPGDNTDQLIAQASAVSEVTDFLGKI